LTALDLAFAGAAGWLKRRRAHAVDEFDGVVAQRRGLLVELGGCREHLVCPLPRAARQFADFGDAGRAARGEAGGAVDALRVTQNQIVDGFQRLSYLVECGFRALEVRPWPS
jgi:hypothetical protein